MMIWNFSRTILYCYQLEIRTMSTTKKSFIELVTFLKQNQDKKVSDVLEQIYEMTLSNKMAEVTRKDEKGQLTHIFCYYHKTWEDVKTIEYGQKASTETGLNTMCKIGVNQWTKQQAEFKKAKADLLIDVANEKVQPKEIKERLTTLESEKDRVVPREETVKLLKAKAEAKANK